MALVAFAILALVSGDVLMPLVHLGAGVLMAARAGGGSGRAGSRDPRAGQGGVARKATNSRVGAAGDTETRVVGRKSSGTEPPPVMALAAIGAKPSGGVVNAGKRGLIVLLLMAADAIGGDA